MYVVNINNNNNDKPFAESSPYATPPRSVKRPLNTPPPSLFKTDIVDRVVEQHELRLESSSVQQLNFEEEDGAEEENNNTRVLASNENVAL